MNKYTQLAASGLSVMTSPRFLYVFGKDIFSFFAEMIGITLSLPSLR